MEVLEVLFKNIKESKVISLLRFLVGGKNNIIDTNSYPINLNVLELYETEIEEKITFYETFTFSLHIKKQNIAHCSVHGDTILLFKELNKYDIRILLDIKYFVEAKCFPSSLTLQAWAQSIAITFPMENYYAGFDPVDDLDMRIFSNNEPGPFFKNNFIEVYTSYRNWRKKNST